MIKICSVDGCDSFIIANLLCSKHYQRLRNHGDVNFTPIPKEPLIDSNGYRLVFIRRVKLYEHRVIAEKVLGKPLPKGAVVHHVNGNRSDNRHENLVICPDKKYHKLLHVRIDAVEAGYPPDYRKCRYCHQYDNPESMRQSCGRIYHKKCSDESLAPYIQRKKLSNSLTLISE